ncbi:YadA-like family protein [uncultured Veillonella sp.]|uniref:YadA C-terminal domain-containing protein n=1 Tax=uncultured Veillonella sp. TaxID=159268 RepID=UPI0028D3679E|nr:YadA-like family protein [uncultured Veillonella sp.]
MNKTLTTALAISALAVNVAGATSNNTVGGTDNTISATSTSSALWGFQNNINANNALAIGTSTVADGKNSIAFGAYVQSHSENTVAIGNSVTANHENSVGIGSGVINNLNNSVGIGSGVITNHDNNIAIGNGVTTNLTNNIGIGNGVVTHHENSIGIGYGVITNFDNNIAIGNGVVTHRKDNIGIGHGVITKGESSVAIGYGVSTDSNNAIAIGNGASVVKDESVAIGHSSKANTVMGTPSYVINSETHNFAGTMPVGTVSIGDTNKERTITNVAAGRISSDSTYAINGSQLFAVVDEVETNATNIANNKTAIQNNANNIDKNAKAIAKNKENIKDIAVGLNMLGDVVNDHEQAIANNTKAISNLNKVTDNHGKVMINHEGRVQTLEQDNKDIKSDVANTQNQVNINTKDIADLKGKFGNVAAINNELNNKVNNLGQRVNKLGASSAALAGLHPLDFNRNDKASYAVSYGHYRNANAVALGAFYRPNERTMIGAGVSLGLGGETQLTLNVAFKTGKGSDYLAEAKDAQSRISKLEALVNKLMSEVEANK